MKLLMCNCTMCKYGRKHSPATRRMIRSKRKVARSKVKNMLRFGEYDLLPNSVYIGYTD